MSDARCLQGRKGALSCEECLNALRDSTLSRQPPGQECRTTQQHVAACAPAREGRARAKASAREQGTPSNRHLRYGAFRFVLLRCQRGGRAWRNWAVKARALLWVDLAFSLQGERSTEAVQERQANRR